MHEHDHARIALNCHSFEYLGFLPSAKKLLEWLATDDQTLREESS